MSNGKRVAEELHYPHIISALQVYQVCHRQIQIQGYLYKAGYDFINGGPWFRSSYLHIPQVMKIMSQDPASRFPIIIAYTENRA